MHHHSSHSIDVLESEKVETMYGLYGPVCSGSNAGQKGSLIEFECHSTLFIQSDNNPSDLLKFT